MEPRDVRIFAAADDFREWLEEHHDTERELWVGFYRRGVPKPSMTYPEAVDEALCFGWIDGQTKRLDDEVTAQRFTPRRKGSNWSAINIAKVARLREAGRMHPAGIRAFQERDPRNDQVYSYERPERELPAELLARLEADPAAWAHWQRETPSYRRTAAHWILSAKRPETRERRFRTLLDESRAGRRPRPFIVSRGT